MANGQTDVSSPRQNVLLIGCGVIGSIYAAQFALEGYNVFVLRHGARQAEQSFNDIRLKEVTTGELVTVPVIAVDQADSYDFSLVIVAVRADQLVSTFPALYSLTGQPHILFFGNNPNGHKLIPADLPGTTQLGFPGVGGSIQHDVVEYVHVVQQATALETTTAPFGTTIRDVLTRRGFHVQSIANMDGWLAYHAVFISCISKAILRASGDAAKLGRDRKLLRLMCRAIEEGFRTLRDSDTAGLPSNLAILHSPLLRPIAIEYWGRLMRSPKGEQYFAAHARTASDEVATLANWVLQRSKTHGSTTRHLNDLLGNDD